MMVRHPFLNSSSSACSKAWNEIQYRTAYMKTIRACAIARALVMYNDCENDINNQYSPSSYCSYDGSATNIDSDSKSVLYE